MERNKAKGYLNIAHKAGYLIIGSDKLDQYDKKLFLIIIDKEAGKNSQKIANRFKDKGIKILEINDLEEFSSIKNCKILGLKNKKLADIILQLLSDNTSN